MKKFAAIAATTVILAAGLAAPAQAADFAVSADKTTNLIAAGDMPPCVAVLVNPGVVPAGDNSKQLPRYNRSVEYDGIDGRYARFLIDELVPEALRRAGVQVDPNPANHVIGGASSGGIAAFTAAWNRPDYFGKVLGFISSFTDLRGGHGYPEGRPAY